jgi:hypothetical protein
MNINTTSQGPRTIAATCTLERTQASLDGESVVRLEWAQHFCRTRGRLRPQPAVILRRALDTYTGLLCRLGDDEEAIRREMQALQAAARGRGSARSTTEARARLEAADGRPVAFLDVLHEPAARHLVASVNAAAEARARP